MKLTQRETYTRGRLMFALRTARKRAEKAGVAYDLHDHIAVLRSRWDRQVCELSGLPLDLTMTGRIGAKWNSPSFDRIEPADGYVLGNVRLICYGLNALFGNWGEDVAAVMVRAWLSERI